MIAILDVDGTLVDTNYQHALAWYRAFRAHEIVLPLWRVHRAIGMGGDQLVKWLTDEDTERRLGDTIRNAESGLYGELIGEVETMEGSRELLVELKRLGHTVVLASSAKPDEIDHYLDLLDAREVADAWTTSGDVEETKPAPDLVSCALERAGSASGSDGAGDGSGDGSSDGSGDGETAILIGDSIWDIEAARNASVDTLAVRTGGFGADELREAGAVEVYESVDELCRGLDETPFS